MRNGTTQFIAASTGVIQGAFNSFITAIIGISLWTYNVFIINPLWVFYYVGMYGGKDPAVMCYEKTGRLSTLSPAYWDENEEHKRTCAAILKQDFASWTSTLCITIYFSLLTFVVIQLLFNCYYTIRPRKPPVIMSPKIQ